MYKVISLESYVKEKNRIIVKTLKQMPHKEQITEIEVSDNRGDPAVLVKANGKDYLFPITKGVEIYVCNQLLNSLDLGMDIHFHSFLQYFYLIERCNVLLQRRIHQVC